MENWQTKALEYFPELRETIEDQLGRGIGIMGLWIELHTSLLAAYDAEPVDDEQIGRIYRYAAWCFSQPQIGTADTDPSSAAAVGLIEDLPLTQRVADDLHRWMSLESFEGCENLFRYHLDDEQYQKFAADFKRKKNSFTGISII